MVVSIEQYRLVDAGWLADVHSTPSNYYVYICSSTVDGK